MRKFVILRHDFLGSANGVAEFFPADSQFLIYFGPNFLLQPVNSGFDVRVLCAIVQPPKPTFLLYEI